jgi:hypothetical protein
MKECTSVPMACVSSWLFKTKMSFFGQELNLPWWFGVACLTYSLSGIFMLYYVPKWLGKSRFPYYSFAYFLIFLQGEFACISFNFTVLRRLGSLDYSLRTEYSEYCTPIPLLHSLGIVTIYLFCFIVFPTSTNIHINTHQP